MSIRMKVALVVAWVLSLGLVARITADGAQVYAARPVSPKVFSGADVGFRVTSMKGETPTGVWVIRVNDQWVEVSPGAVLLR